MAKECECGCGATVKPESRFRRGHNRWGGPRPEPPNPSGLCMCGCGRPTPVARQGDREYGWVKGEHLRYLTGHQTRRSPVDYIVDDGTGCWVWQLGQTGKGYGVAVVAGRKTRIAHRVVYERLVGPVPEGHELHHRCVIDGDGTTLCVNPDHLEPVTVEAHYKLHAAEKRLAA